MNMKETQEQEYQGNHRNQMNHGSDNLIELGYE
jgi:hypothetical protein